MIILIRIIQISLRWPECAEPAPFEIYQPDTENFSIRSVFPFLEREKQNTMRRERKRTYRSNKLKVEFIGGQQHISARIPIEHEFTLSVRTKGHERQSRPGALVEQDSLTIDTVLLQYPYANRNGVRNKKIGTIIYGELKILSYI